MKRILATVILVPLVVMTACGLLSCSSPGDSGPADPIVVAYSPFESAGLFLVAVGREMFADHGLDLTLYQSDSGAAALDDMLDGKAELAVSVAEFPLVRKVFQSAPARAVASIDRADFIYIVARRDREIASPADLKGKRTGTAAGSIAEFHLGRFLSLNGLGIQDVTYVSVGTPSETAGALVDGELDAAVLAQPYADQAAERLGANAVVWPAQSGQALYALAVSTDEWLAAHPEQAMHFLEALVEAEQYMHAHPIRAKAIIQEFLDFDSDYMDVLWRQNQFSLSLDQSLILAMEDEARWMISNGLVSEKQVPDFLQVIYEETLAAVEPEAVDIIR